MANRAHDELWAAYRREPNDAARNALVEAYLPLLQKIAWDLLRKMPQSAGFVIDDLVSLGTFGLVKAIERFEPSRGFQFATYAALPVRGAILDGLRDFDWVPRLERLREKRGEVVPRKIDSLERLAGSAGRGTRFELAEAGSFRPSVGEEIPRELLKGSSTAERIIVLRYYVDGCTFKAIGESLGISESRVSQIHSAFTKRLRSQYGSDWKLRFGEHHGGVAGGAARHARNGSGVRLVPARSAEDGRGSARGAGPRGFAHVSDVPGTRTIAAAPAPSLAGSRGGVAGRLVLVEGGRMMQELLKLVHELTPDGIRAEIAARQREIAALEVLLPVRDALHGQTPPRGAPLPEPAREIAHHAPDPAVRLSQKEERKAMIVQVLRAARRPLSASTIARDTGIPSGSISPCLHGHELLEQIAGGHWQLKAGA